MLSRSVKPRICENCGKEFLPFQSMQKVCPTVKCARGYVKKLNAVRTKEWRERRQALKTIPDLIKEAQREFNAYIRARDVGRPCICCGLPLGADAVGGGFDCGHWRSVGSAPHLRFDERNAHGQRKQCNRYGAGRAVEYRQGLIVRLGLHVVEALEADNRVHKWTREELIAIRDTYRAKLKELKARSGE
jgi:hypothetical protein